MMVGTGIFTTLGEATTKAHSGILIAMLIGVVIVLMIGISAAQVCHTGLSNRLHLHFQLMDGPDFLSARGLPCSFTNIQDVAGRQINLIEEDDLIIHAE